MRLVLILFTFFAWANSDYHDQVFLGESFDREYSGPLNPSYVFYPDILRFQLEDEIFYDSISKQHADSFFSLLDYQQKQLSSSAECSNKLLGDNINYIRYLFRLIAINYVYESINLAYLDGFKYGGEAKACNINWREEINKCRPESKDMQTYISRVRQVVPTHADTSQLQVIKRSKIKENIKTLKANVKKLRNNDLPTTLTRYFCQRDNCQDLDIEQITRIFNRSCESLKNQFTNLCNEKDEFFGISQSDIARRVLADSEVISFRSGDLGSCLTRYVRMFKAKEFYPNYITSIFDSVFKKLKNDDSTRYVQGKIFVPGALKRFDEQGLSSFLFAPKKVAHTSVKPKVTKTKKTVTKAEPVIKLVKTPKPTTVAKSEPEEIKKKESKKEILSGFEWSVREVYENGKEISYVSESRLKRDFRYNRETKNFLKEVLAPYQTRKTLENMKIYDKLGSKKEPVRLSFLKFLVDEEKHQALFNIMQIIGNQFYVLNDIEEKDQPVLFEMRNSEKTKYKWEFLIVRPAF